MSVVVFDEVSEYNHSDSLEALKGRYGGSVVSTKPHSIPLLTETKGLSGPLVPEFHIMSGDKVTRAPTQYAKGTPVPHAQKFAHRPNTKNMEMPSRGILFQSAGYEGGPASEIKLMAVAGDSAACGYFRVAYPSMILAMLGAQVDVRVHNAESPDLNLEDFFDANVILVQRAVHKDLLTSIHAISKLTGATLLYDLDDFLHGVAKNSPAFPTYDPKSPMGKFNLQTIEEYLTTLDGVIFSTRELAATYDNVVTGIHTLPIGLDHNLGHRDWDLSKPKFDWRTLAAEQGCKPTDEKSLLFGWSGGSTHRTDLAEMGRAIENILKNTKNTFFGINTDARTAYELCVTKWKLPLNRVVFIPPVPFTEYPRLLSAFDVALCPLHNTVFNRAKSCLRILEFGAWGVPYVASKVAPFQRYHRETEGQGGFTANDPKEFEAFTIRLLNDEALRLKMGAFQLETVRNKYDIRETALPLCHTIKCFMEKRISGSLLPSWIDIHDETHNLPKLKGSKLVELKKDQCPCGSNKQYGQCCFPAFGAWAK